MVNDKVKHDSLEHLLGEIDEWMSILQKKKQALLAIAKNDYVTDKDGKMYKLVLKESDVDGFKAYSCRIDKKIYDVLVKAADKYKMTVSTFIKKKYFLNFIYLKNRKEVYGNNLKLYAKVLADKYKELASNDKKAIALALNVNDSRNLDKVVEELKISNPREFIRYLVSTFLYEYYISKKISPDYVGEDEGLNWINCKSSNVASYCYIPKDKILYLAFRGGRKYKYTNVPIEVYESLVSAPSKGDYVNKYIAYKFEYKKIN